MDQGCTFLHRLEGIKNAGKRFILYLDEIARLLGDILIDRCHRRHPFIQIPHLCGSQGLLISGRSAPSPFKTVKVLTGNDRFNPGQPLSLARINIEYPGMGMRAPLYVAP